MRFPPLVYGALCLLAIPAAAIAITTTPDAAVSAVAGSLPTPSITGDTSNFGAIFRTVSSVFIPLVYFIAGLIVVRAALLLILEQSESELSQFKTSLIGAIVAIFVVNLADALSGILFAGPGTNILTDPDTVVSGLEDEFLGLIRWIEVIIAVLAITMIIVSGIRAVLAYGSDDGLTHVKRTVISVLTGIFFIVTKAAFAETFAVTYRPEGLMDEVVRVIAIVLAFVTIVAVAVLIIAGLMMVINLGNDEQYQRARGIVVRVAIGLLVILTSTAIIGIFIVS